MPLAFDLKQERTTARGMTYRTVPCVREPDTDYEVVLVVEGAHPCPFNFQDYLTADELEALGAQFIATAKATREMRPDA